MGMIIGIDIGGSTTKIVGMDRGRAVSPIRVKADDPVTSAYGAFGKFLAENQMDIGQVDRVLCTGVGSSFVRQDIYGIPSERVDEFRAIGLGGRQISGCGDAIIVSMGTGTAFVKVEGGSICHMGGTGVGGGALVGLCDRMLGIRSVEHIVKLAEKGSLANVDLTIGDISSAAISNMDRETTAANFGKLSDLASPEDLALGVCSMVFQTVGVMAAFCARGAGLRDIVLTGNLARLPMARKIFSDFEKLYDARFRIPERADFATAIGAALAGERA